MAEAVIERCESREQWLARRLDFVGGSEAAMLCGFMGYAQSPVRLWSRKLGLTPEQPSTPQMERGRILEPYVAEMVAQETGLPMRDHGAHTLAWHPTIPHFAVTLDRDIGHPEWGPGPCELKTSGYRRQEWGVVFGLDVEADPLVVPPNYYCQVQAQLSVTGAEWAMLAVLLGLDELRYYRVSPNAEWIEAIEQAVVDFWPYVERQEEPLARGAEDLPITRLLHEYKKAGVWVNGAGALMVVDEEWVTAEAHRRDLAEELRHWKGVKDTTEARLRQTIGEARGLVLPNGVCWERGSRGRLKRRGNGG